MTDKCCPIADLPAVPERDRDVASAWVRDALWAALADLYERYHEEEGLTYAALGRRVGRSRAQVQRWLDAPVNMTLASAGLIAEALDADLTVSIEPRCPADPWTNHICPAEAAKDFVQHFDAPFVRFPSCGYHADAKSKPVNFQKSFILTKADVDGQDA